MITKFYKSLLIIISALIFIAGNTTAQAQNSEYPRQNILFDFDWKFYLGDVENAQNTVFNDSLWRIIDLPHDWSIEDIPGTNSPFDSTAIWGIDGGYLAGGTGWYRKTFELPENSINKKVSVYFEGVYMNADVWLNGTHLGNHPYGYTSFEYDISDLINREGKNVLAVRVRNEGRNSRWYSGSGIYRHVWLKITEPLHVKTWGVFVSTPMVKKDSALVNIKTEIVNETPVYESVTLTTSILDDLGNMVSEDKKEIQLNSMSAVSINQQILINSPQLWFPENPALYQSVTEITDKSGKILDKVETAFGIRSIEFSVEKGFLLNGVPTLLKGGCMHHDNGPLGAAAYDRAEERRVELMKASGFNAIRCAHNPPSEAFLNACDRLGMLVIDETFDMWNNPKNPQDYSNYFDEWWQRDVDAMVLRDRNHPSVIMWSIGNEIPEQGRNEGFKTSKLLADYIRSKDATRPVTAAVNNLGPDKDPFFKNLDISGYNYSFGGDHGQKSIFERDHERVPDRIMFCSESYPLEAFGAWMDVLKYPYVIGDFVWTGFDYLGEASIGWRGYPHDESFYPWNHAYCGDIDICGFKRSQSYYRNVLWKAGTQLTIVVKPPVPSFPQKVNRASWSKWHWHDWLTEWNWEGYENEQMGVIVYSGYEKVELFLNGKSLGIKPTGTETEFMAWWNVPFVSGELKAVGIDADSIAAVSTLNSAHKPVQIKLVADRTNIKANGQDLSYVTVELTDENGFLHPKADNLMEFEIQGPGEIVAVASSNPLSVESFQQPRRKAYKGRCMVIIKSGTIKGEITLTAKSKEFTDAQITLNSK